MSELCKNLDSIIEAQLNGPLSYVQYPFLLVDAMYLKAKEDGGVRSRGVMIAVGINRDRYRKVLGMMAGDTESKSGWSEFFGRLKDRGLHGVDIITSYDHRGLVRAIRRYFQGVTWQRCYTKQPKVRSTLSCAGYLRSAR